MTVTITRVGRLVLEKIKISVVKGTVLLTTFENKHLEKQPSAVQNGIHLTPAAERTRFINRLDVLQRKHQGGYCL